MMKIKIIFIIITVLIGGVLLEKATKIANDGEIVEDFKGFEGIASEQIDNVILKTTESFFETSSGNGVSGFRSVFVSLDEIIPFVEFTGFQDMFDKAFKGF